MEAIKLNAQTRKIIGKKVKNLIIDGKIPAVLYGQGIKSINLELNLAEFNKIYKNAGISSLVDLSIDKNKPIKILIHEPQMDPIKDQPIHADLYQIKMDEELTTEIPLEFVGVSIAVKELEGNLIKNKEAVKVECLPADLIPNISVDIAVLKTFEDIVRVKDLKVPEKIKILDEPEDTVVLVTPPRSEEELEAMEAEATADTEKAGIEKIEKDAEAEKAAKVAAKEGEQGEEKPEADAKTANKPAEAPKKEEKKK